MHLVLLKTFDNKELYDKVAQKHMKVFKIKHQCNNKCHCYITSLRCPPSNATQVSKLLTKPDVILPIVDFGIHYSNFNPNVVLQFGNGVCYATKM